VTWNVVFKYDGHKSRYFSPGLYFCMQRQMRLIIGHLSRVAVSAAELGRGLAYLTSAIDQNNMFLFQLYPGYMQMQGINWLYVS